MSSMPVALGDPKKTQDLLWKRIRERGNLPGFSNVVGRIVGAMQSDNDREFSMTSTVLSDPALTQRVLRLANSAMYSMFGEISTVSKAVILLGTEAIGHLALGLKLIDSFTKASGESGALRSEMEKAVLAGRIAREVTANANSRDTEEAVVCSLLHGLGRMLVVYYLPDHWSLVQARLTGKKTDRLDESAAALAVLGLPLDDVGRLMAAHWGLPNDLIESLRDVEPRQVDDDTPVDRATWLAALSTMSTGCARAICDSGESVSDLEAYVGSYAPMLGLDGESVLAAVDVAKQKSIDENRRPAAVETPAPAPEHNKPADSLRILTCGVAEMRDAARATSSQLMTMALETAFKGLGLTRAITFLRNREKQKYIAGMGFGENLGSIISRLSFSDVYHPDVIHAALASDKMICIRDAHDPAFRSKLPRWWIEANPEVASFIVLPLIVNRNPVGFIYGDWDKLKAPPLEDAEIVALNELRALVMRPYVKQAR